MRPTEQNNKISESIDMQSVTEMVKTFGDIDKQLFEEKLSV